MDIYAPINKHFLENKKIKISFSKVLNKKEKYFLKFLFMEYKLLEKFEKATILQDVDLNEILDVLKFSTFEQLKKIIENSNLSDNAKEFYLSGVTNLDAKKQKSILDLVIKMDKAGFRNNIPAAYSEVTENIPQFARMSVFKEMQKIIRDIEGNLELADDFYEDDKELLDKFNACFTDEEAERFLQIYTKSVISKFYSFLDEGNPRAEEDDLNWVLLETKADGSHNDRVIEGFLEDDFNEDDYDWDIEDES